MYDNWVDQYIYISNEDGKYYWVDETGDPSNPHDTLQQARTELNDYIEYLRQESEDDVPSGRF